MTFGESKVENGYVCIPIDIIRCWRDIYKQRMTSNFISQQLHDFYAGKYDVLGEITDFAEENMQYNDGKTDNS